MAVFQIENLAAKKVKELLSGSEYDPETTWIKIEVKKISCSNYVYNMTPYANLDGVNELNITKLFKEDAKFFVENDQMKLLEDTTMFYGSDETDTSEKPAQGFKFLASRMSTDLPVIKCSSGGCKGCPCG